MSGTILRGIFTKAEEWGFVFKNPVKGIKLKKERPRSRFLNEHERMKLIAACDKEPKAPYLRSMVMIDSTQG